MEGVLELTGRISPGLHTIRRRRPSRPRSTRCSRSGAASARISPICRSPACARCGLPARYVSGYLLTRPPEGSDKLIGADASHAWLSVWCPGHGWVDVDPTNNLLPVDEHITLAWGRDYGDVSPVNGAIFGGGAHTVQVAVDVNPVVRAG